MNNNKALREHLIYLLTDGGAHLKYEEAVKDMPAKLMGVRPEGSPHSPWELLEHLRITLWDILEFSRNPKHVSPDFPTGYWPKTQAPPNEKAWNKSVESFQTDLKAMVELVRNESTDLFAKIPHGDGQTILREAMLTADHNSYHLGQLVMVRRLLGAWQ